MRLVPGADNMFPLPENLENLTWWELTKSEKEAAKLAASLGYIEGFGNTRVEPDWLQLRESEVYTVKEIKSRIAGIIAKYIGKATERVNEDDRQELIKILRKFIPLTELDFNQDTGIVELCGLLESAVETFEWYWEEYGKDLQYQYGMANTFGDRLRLVTRYAIEDREVLRRSQDAIDEFRRRKNSKQDGSDRTVNRGYGDLFDHLDRFQTG